MQDWKINDNVDDDDHDNISFKPIPNIDLPDQPGIRYRIQDDLIISHACD